MVQLPGISDPNRIKELLGKTAHMTFQLVDETASANTGGTPPPGVDYLPMQDNPNQKVAVRRRIDVDGGDLTDARAGTNPQTGEWVVNFTFNSVGARRFADVTRTERQPPLRHRAGRQGDQRAGDPRADHRRARSDQRLVHRRVGQRPGGAAARRCAAGAADGGGGTQRRPGTGRRLDPRRRDLAGGRVRPRDRASWRRSTGCSAGSRMSAWWSTWS